MNLIGQPFITLQQVDSTNNYAMAQAHARLATHGTTYFAMEQTGGKGQRGKNWFSLPGENIMQSVVIEPGNLPAASQFCLSAATALACYDFFNVYAGDETFIKWPNDLYWRDRKAGGILIENVLSGKVWQYAIAGTGININQTVFDVSLPNPVSLKQITGKHYDVLELASQLCSRLQKRYEQLHQGNFSELLEQYNKVLYKKGQTIRLKKDNRVFNCTLEEVNNAGQLVVKTGIEEHFDFGEVEWVIA
ncbi:MAG: biotin--[acetyl-CoA-carboxylase] ligase [Chitinophagaceae bacterium]|nr:biotin--[acetyl-CoA-carboxylase] ligase [Chitinophagaceae bacterium]